MKKALGERTTALGVIGSGNVFADLGLPDAETLLLKAKLVSRIDDAIKNKSLTRADAARAMKLRPADVSELLNGCTNNYSVEDLRRILASLEAN